MSKTIDEDYVSLMDTLRKARSQMMEVKQSPTAGRMQDDADKMHEVYEKIDSAIGKLYSYQSRVKGSLVKKSSVRPDDESLSPSVSANEIKAICREVIAEQMNNYEGGAA